jgi:hypothetical protein
MNQIWEALWENYFAPLKLTKAVTDFWLGKPELDYSKDDPGEHVVRFIDEKKRHVA